MKKILIFGNGISMKYAPYEYSYEVVKEKFIEGLNIIYQREISGHLIDYPEFMVFLNEILRKEFHEGTFFEIYKKICIEMLKNKYGGIRDYRIIGYSSPEEFWNICYETIKNNLEGILGSYFYHIFGWAYKMLDFAICRSLTINKDYNNWIEIKYENNFVEYLSTYSYIYTTNYYVDKKNIKHNVNYLHGQIMKNIDKFLNESNSKFKIEHQKGYEFLNSNILYGGSYEDKIFMNSVLHWTLNTILKRKEIDFIKINDKFVVDIIGLSTEGDKHIIKEIGTTAEQINIFCYTQKDFENWKREMKDFAKKANFYCSHTYDGFENKKKNNDCPKLCKK